LSDAPDSTEPKKEESKEAPVAYRRNFNPMKTYFEMAIGIFGAYILLYALGMEFLIMFMLFVLVYIFRETKFILDNYDYGFARKAAVFNAFHSTAWFVVLAINGYTILQFGAPLILPEIDVLTTLSPLFILMAIFGLRNISSMYAPTKKSII
jgi:hypothetical protein